MRTGKLIIPQNDACLIALLIEEAKFYSLTNMVDELSPRLLFENSAIVTEQQCAFLNLFAGKSPLQKWKQLYKVHFCYYQ